MVSTLALRCFSFDDQVSVSLQFNSEILHWGWKIIAATPAGVLVGLDFGEESNC